MRNTEHFCTDLINVVSSLWGLLEGVVIEAGYQVSATLSIAKQVGDLLRTWFTLKDNCCNNLALVRDAQEQVALWASNSKS